jgi:hypothetical protein
MLISPSKLTVPSTVLSFHRFSFTLPVQNKFRTYRALQHHERKAHAA